ncbi:MAG TPA: AfsR/SARP family transcriptional regulator [Rugosimonospora sp.]|nr:AfsR/SARP family transcriptional regulator [Rugosimonospora sp.]
MRFTALGPLEVFHDHCLCKPTAPKARQVLALLLLRANQVVPISALVEELWGEQPPQSAVTTVQTYVYQLRKMFERAGYQGPDQELLATRPPGYLLRLCQDQLDADVFGRLVQQGRMLVQSNRLTEAADRLRRALELWRGSALANVTQGPLLRGYVADLEEQRMRAVELRIQANAALGRHRELIGELRILVSQYPLNEWLHAQLIVALNAAGRRGEALQAYHALREILTDELGLDPSPALRRLHHDVLKTGTVPSIPTQRPGPDPDGWSGWMPEEMAARSDVAG